MKDWENYFAGSLIYQDLADCSLGSVPVLTEIEQTQESEKDEKDEKTKKDGNINDNVIVVDILPKASAFLILILAMVTTI